MRRRSSTRGRSVSLNSVSSYSDADPDGDFWCEIGIWHQTAVEITVPFAFGPIEEQSLDLKEGATATFGTASRVEVLRILPGRVSSYEWGNGTDGFRIFLHRPVVEPGTPPQRTPILFVWPPHSPVMIESLSLKEAAVPCSMATAGSPTSNKPEPTPPQPRSACAGFPTGGAPSSGCRRSRDCPRPTIFLPSHSKGADRLGIRVDRHHCIQRRGTRDPLRKWRGDSRKPLSHGGRGHNPAKLLEEYERRLGKPVTLTSPPSNSATAPSRASSNGSRSGVVAWHQIGSLAPRAVSVLEFTVPSLRRTRNRRYG